MSMKTKNHVIVQPAMSLLTLTSSPWYLKSYRLHLWMYVRYMLYLFVFVQKYSICSVYCCISCAFCYIISHINPNTSSICSIGRSFVLISVALNKYVEWFCTILLNKGSCVSCYKMALKHQTCLLRLCVMSTSTKFLLKIKGSDFSKQSKMRQQREAA